MPPRQRIFRSAYGRAQASIRSYDEGLKSCGRENLAGAAQSIRFLEAINPEEFELCDYLWNTERFPTLYVELWHLHELQITRLCKAVVSKDWGIPAREVNDFFDNDAVVIDGWRLFNGVFGTTWQAGGGHGEEISYREWKNVRNQLVHGRSSSIGISRLEEGCVYLCTVIQATADFGKATATAYNGLAPFATIGLASSNATDGNWGERLEETEGDIPDYPRMKWVKFKSEILNDVARTREC